MHHHVALPMTHRVSSFELVLRHCENFLRTLFRCHRICLVQHFHHVKCVHFDLVVHRQRSFGGGHKHNPTHFLLGVPTSEQSFCRIFFGERVRFVTYLVLVWQMLPGWATRDTVCVYFCFALTRIVQSNMCRVISAIDVHAFRVQPLFPIYCFPHWVLI